MAFFPAQSATWGRRNNSHRYIKREVLVALLNSLPENATLIGVTPVGELGVYSKLSDDGLLFDEQLGYISIGSEEYSPFEADEDVA